MEVHTFTNFIWKKMQSGKNRTSRPILASKRIKNNTNLIGNEKYCFYQYGFHQNIVVTIHIHESIKTKYE